MSSQFSEIQPGIRKWAMLVLEDRWPQWDTEAIAAVDPWPGRDVVVVELLRALREAGMINGVFRADYAATTNPCCRRCGKPLNVGLIPDGVGGPDRHTMYCTSKDACGAAWDQFGEEINADNS